MKSVVITGVSTGIGLDAARRLLTRGYRVFGSVRKQADAERLQAELGENFVPLLFDVTDGAAVDTAVFQVKSIIGSDGLYGLVNNAGISVTGPLMHVPIDELRWQFEVNLFGLLDVTQKFLPLLGAVKDAPFPPGRIVNISSVSGKITYPFMGPYAASKHALEAMSDALRRELLYYGIDVIVIEPGTTQTPIIEKTAVQSNNYEATDYGEVMAEFGKKAVERQDSALPVAKVTDAIVIALEKPNPKTRYAVPRKWFMGWIAPRLLPDRLFDKIAANQLGFKK